MNYIYCGLSGVGKLYRARQFLANKYGEGIYNVKYLERGIVCSNFHVEITIRKRIIDKIKEFCTPNILVGKNTIILRGNLHELDQMSIRRIMERNQANFIIIIRNLSLVIEAIKSRAVIIYVPMPNEVTVGTITGLSGDRLREVCRLSSREGHINLKWVMWYKDNDEKMEYDEKIDCLIIAIHKRKLHEIREILFWFYIGCWDSNQIAKIIINWLLERKEISDIKKIEIVDSISKLRCGNKGLLYLEAIILTILCAL